MIGHLILRFYVFNNLDLLKKYHEWHKKLVNTNGETYPRMGSGYLQIKEF